MPWEHGIEPYFQQGNLKKASLEGNFEAWLWKCSRISMMEGGGRTWPLRNLGGELRGRKYRVYGEKKVEQMGSGTHQGWGATSRGYWKLGKWVTGAVRKPLAASPTGKPHTRLWTNRWPSFLLLLSTHSCILYASYLFCSAFAEKWPWYHFCLQTFSNYFEIMLSFLFFSLLSLLAWCFAIWTSATLFFLILLGALLLETNCYGL